MRRRTLLKAAAVTPLAAVQASPGGPRLAVPRFARTLASGLDIPWGLDFLPDGSALFYERDGGRMMRVRRRRLHRGRHLPGHPQR